MKANTQFLCPATQAMGNAQCAKRGTGGSMISGIDERLDGSRVFEPVNTG